MHIKPLLLFVFIILSVHAGLRAQDIHFTQFNMSPMTLNPALQGNFLGTVRLGGIYRSQWNSILGRGQYSTPAFYADAPIIRGFRKRDWVGVGLSFVTDQTGSTYNPDGSRAGSALQRTLFALGATYHLALDKKANTVLSIGAQYGNDSRSAGAGHNFRDEIINGTPISMDPYDANSGELSANFTDINAGISLTSRFNERMSVTLGFAMYHLNTPDYTYEGGMNQAAMGSITQAQLPSRSVVHGVFNVDLTEKWTISPTFLFQTMNGNDEIIVQGLAAYRFDEVRDIDLHFGASYRLSDAVSPILGGRYKDLRVGLAYDFNISDLNSETNYRGGFEIAANYIIKIYKKSKIEPKILCPRF